MDIVDGFDCPFAPESNSQVTALDSSIRCPAANPARARGRPGYMILRAPDRRVGLTEIGDAVGASPTLPDARRFVTSCGDSSLPLRGQSAPRASSRPDLGI